MLCGRPHWGAKVQIIVTFLQGKKMLRAQKTFLVIKVFLLSTFILSCSFTDNPDNIPQDNSMYETFVLSEEELISTEIPTVYIETQGQQQILSKEDWLYTTMEIAKSPDKSWNFETVNISIRGRGNTTWGQTKKPFAIKLDKKQSICGLAKHKRWVLIANYLDNSFLKNSSAFILSEML